MLPKKFRLPAKEFNFVYQKGKKIRGEYGMFVFNENKEGYPRFGFVVSKKIGNAVLRHRMTRLIRVSVMEIVNENNFHELGFDFQYIAFKFCDKKSLLKSDMESLILKEFND